MIVAAQLDQVLGAVSTMAAATGLAHEALTGALRAAMPGVTITVCSEDDIPPRLPAAAENAYCLLHYIDAGEHCLKLTTDAEAASGIVVALRGDDD
jgi:hypothetical protein